jgi:hypothetical protein
MSGPGPAPAAEDNPQTTLDKIIADRIPAATLERVVFDQNFLDSSRRERLFKPCGLSALEVARGVVAEYGSNTSRLAFGLFEQVRATDWQTAELLYGHFESAGGAYYNHQASLVCRLPDLPLDALNEFLTTVKSQVCLIVSRKGGNKLVRGTGFLVGPDLVLTCRHVLEHFPENADLSNGQDRIEIYFDFYQGEAVECLSPVLPAARKVGLAHAWTVEWDPVANPDGLAGDLSPQEKTRIASSLDFMLLRLDEKVGLQPVKRSGGRQRRWVDLSAATMPKAVHDEDWIIIPQHPKGKPQRIDLGRFRTTDPTETRLRYDTNTAPGSSGAPCFNHEFKLVGVHNATVGPPDNPISNQAIRASLIAARVEKHVSTAVPVGASGVRWAIARPNEPARAILGRDHLLAWLQASAGTTPLTLANRVYVAHTDCAAAGCSFSLDVLLDQLEGTKVPRIVYGRRGQQLPATVEDFLLSLLHELGITLGSRETIPRRPEPAGGSLGGEVDKPSRWLSQELPEWLGDIIERHVQSTADAVPEAKRAVLNLEMQGIEVPAKLRQTAESDKPVFVRTAPWDYAYVVLDDLRTSAYSGQGFRTELTGDVRELIAALVRGKSESSMHSGLRRLRWMFLGYLPSFLAAAPGSEGDGPTVETLDPAAVGGKEVLAVFDRMSQTHIGMQPGAEVWAKVLAKAVVDLAAMDAGSPRMASLERETNKVAASLWQTSEG